MQRWSQFSLGLLAGVVVVLLTIVILQNREPQAHAVTQAVDNTGSGLLMGIGASTQNQNDIAWVLVKHPAPKRPAGADTKDSIVASKDERMTLCCYQVSNGARSMRLVATRDISFDIDVPELNNERPSVKTIVEELRKTLPKEPPK
jgi:hypothetical protein